jgi:hypothetical protein
MKRPPSHFRDNRGMASVAVLIFSMVAVLILVANFRLNYAANESGDAFDTFNSQVVEKNGLAQIVKESILAVGETATTDSGNSIQTEIQNRLGSMNFPAGVSLTLGASVPSVPANPFFPSGMPAAVAQPAYFSASPRGIAGMGNLFTSLAIQGPSADLGTLTFTFYRVSTNSPSDNQTYTVNANVFSVPLTNVDVIAYGLPASGLVPSASPAVTPGFFGSGVSSLVVTSNNPSNDPTAFPDLFNPTGTERLPYQFRNAVSFSWNAYEFLWSYAYQDALRNAATAAGATYDFSAAQNPAIPGVSAAGNALTIDCSAVQSSIVAVIDSEGVGSITLLGSAAAGNPFVLLVRNTAGTVGRTQVTFSGSNNRPAIFYLENSNVTFAGDPQIQGALFLDPTTLAAGNVTWFGHFSFYAPASPLGTLNITMGDSPAVKAALAPLAPRVLLVSTSAIR